MKYTLTISGVHPLRHKHWIFHPGTYKVPDDMPESFAKWAQKEGAIIERPGQMKMKQRAPEDKKQPAAVENKARPT